MHKHCKYLPYVRIANILKMLTANCKSVKELPPIYKADIKITVTLRNPKITI